MYQERTQSIEISVEPFYLDDESRPEDNQFVFGYRITITNVGSHTVQLLSRHWRITDGNGTTMEVKGAGVVGQQPILAPGERFAYASGAPLATPSGIMVGTYEMVTEEGERFEARIPAFSLDAPGCRVSLN
ncbi:MAG TPA: Co2+/Mg2+ efflux protein ApaG [Geminicoccaceae bacterium]